MENLVSTRLQKLVQLQKTDSKLDEITKVRGSLPDEVRDIEDKNSILSYKIR